MNAYSTNTTHYAFTGNHTRRACGRAGTQRLAPAAAKRSMHIITECCSRTAHNLNAAYGVPAERDGRAQFWFCTRYLCRSYLRLLRMGFACRQISFPPPHPHRKWRVGVFLIQLGADSICIQFYLRIDSPTMMCTINWKSPIRGG